MFGECGQFRNLFENDVIKEFTQSKSINNKKRFRFCAIRSIYDIND
jgi:hypothetical protein